MSCSFFEIAFVDRFLALLQPWFHACFQAWFLASLLVLFRGDCLATAHARSDSLCGYRYLCPDTDSRCLVPMVSLVSTCDALWQAFPHIDADQPFWR